MSQFDNMSPAAMEAWQRLTQSYGQPLSVNSAYRSPEHNAKVGGAKRSQHTHGNAFDVDVSGMDQNTRLDLIRQARASGFQGVGVYDNALHFDVGPSRAWGGDYTSASLPSWAADAVGAPVGTQTAQAGGNPQQRAGMPAPAQPEQQQQPQMPQFQNALRVEDFLRRERPVQYQRFT